MKSKILETKIELDSHVLNEDVPDYLYKLAKTYLEKKYGSRWDNILKHPAWNTPYQQHRYLAELVYFFDDVDSEVYHSVNELTYEVKQPEEMKKLNALDLAVILGNIGKRTGLFE